MWFPMKDTGEQPTITTERLILRPLTMEDAPVIQSLAADPDIAATTSDSELPEPGTAGQWIKIRQLRYKRSDTIDFAVTLCSDDTFIGTISLGYEYKKDESMQLGYWPGKDYWNCGYCTEAARAVVKYGFEVLGLHRIFSRHFTGNPASGRVLQKAGMKHEGTLRQAYNKSGIFENLECHGILKSEYSNSEE